ncbi:MAG: 4-alpha-glucanotransferase [Desulfovibrionales bacterium]
MKRQSGILLHITSLPSKFGIGDLGPGAFAFVDLLAESHQSLWQVLPLGPTTMGSGNSPYSSLSAFAGNPLLISPEHLLRDGCITEEHIGNVPHFPKIQVDYQSVWKYKEGFLSRAYAGGMHWAREKGFDDFCSRNAFWLEDYALFSALKVTFDHRHWMEWPEEIRARDEVSLSRAREELAGMIEEEKFRQFIFARQWIRLREHCQRKHIQLIGDIPIYVNSDSSDVWSHPNLFKLMPDRTPEVVAGVPPDYFSETGQLWGNPVYDWEEAERTGFSWWIQRLEHKLERFDYVRLDHFRGFAASWEVPVTAETAKEGRWQKAPGRSLFATVREKLGKLPFIAEDLGYITEDVHALRDEFELPGMRVLVFGFGEQTGPHPFLPHNYTANSVVYTGTHDNPPVKEWYQKETSHKERERISVYVGKEVDEENVGWELIRLAMMSVAGMAVFPMQDVLGLGGESRMNVPSEAEGNWKWRLSPWEIDDQVMLRFKEMTVCYGRDLERTKETT